MTIGLYDIDFFHGTGFAPNLELMKIYNYYLNQGHQVLFLRPQDNMGRCNKIIYFKARVKTPIPKTLNIIGEDKLFYGYGFLKSFIPLQSDAKDCPPSFLPYELQSSKMNKKDLKWLEKVKKNSIIRLENKDLSYFNENCGTIYIADEKVTTDTLNWIVETYPKYKLDFLHTVKLTSETELLPLISYLSTMDKPPAIDFDYNSTFFKKYCGLSVKWQINPKKAESNLNFFVERLLKMILWNKQNKENLRFYLPAFSKEEQKHYPILKYVLLMQKWGYTSKQISFFDFLSSKKQRNELTNIVNDKSKLRILIKQNPVTETVELDF